MSSRTNKHSAELFDHCPDLIHCPTCKSLVAGFTGAVKLRKTPAPRVRELQNPSSTPNGIPHPCLQDAAFFFPAGRAKGKGETLITKQLKE